MSRDTAGAAEAARRGDWPEVLAQLSSVETAATGAADDFALLASAHLHAGSSEAAEAAADRALQLDAANLRAALVKADLLYAREALKEANLFYRAVAETRAVLADLPPDLAEGVGRARALRDRLARDIFSHVQAELGRAGYVEGRSSSRFTHALDLATGKRQAYFQQPQAFYFPELPNTQFYPREQFPWLDAIEAETETITAELEAVLRTDETFAPYIRSIPGLPNQADYPLIDSTDWSACFLWKDGRETPIADRCPRTMAALEAAPLCRIAGRSPQIMFSQLKAGAHIRPHYGFVNTRLICHLPLIVPPGCRFRVGNEVRSWEKGKAWVFDDTIEHEAWNDSDALRVVLIFDVWHPQLSAAERALITAMSAGINAYTGTMGGFGL